MCACVCVCVCVSVCVCVRIPAHSTRKVNGQSFSRAWVRALFVPDSRSQPHPPAACQVEGQWQGNGAFTFANGDVFQGNFQQSCPVSGPLMPLVLIARKPSGLLMPSHYESGLARPWFAASHAHNTQGFSPKGGTRAGRTPSLTATPRC